VKFKLKKIQLPNEFMIFPSLNVIFPAATVNFSVSKKLYFCESASLNEPNLDLDRFGVKNRRAPLKRGIPRIFINPIVWLLNV